MKEFKERCQQFEDDIGHATSMMEKALEQLFPARGKKLASVTTTGQCAELISAIEELLSSQKEAVTAKLALLMIPK
jgi:hypothetical protein